MKMSQPSTNSILLILKATKGVEYLISPCWLLVNFIHKATVHVAQCQALLNLKVVNKKYGAGIIQQWECPKCKEELQLWNCEWKRSVRERGRNYARLQPEINIRIAMGARVN